MHFSLFNFPVRHRLTIVFLCIALCIAGIYSAIHMQSSIFPRTDFPRVVVLIDNGVMPANEMMATITRPVEESMKDIPGVATIRSRTGRGSAEVNVFFDWGTDMPTAELYVRSKLAIVQKTLPLTSTYTVSRLTFSAFPVIGLSLTSDKHHMTSLWETARYDLQPRLLRIHGVAKVGILGGRVPEYHIVVDPLKLQALNLSITQVADLLFKSNMVAPAGMLEENYKLYLTVTDGRAHSIEEIENLSIHLPIISNTLSTQNSQVLSPPIRIKDFAIVERSQEPVFNTVTADGRNAVLMNIYSQPDGSTLDIAKQVSSEINKLKNTLPEDIKIQLFYDQSTLVSESIKSVWEAILIGLFLAVVILYLFLKHWGTTLVASVVIPVTVSVSALMLYMTGLGFNLMTLGGVAASIGLIIDDAIVVVEAIYAKMQSDKLGLSMISTTLSEIFRPLLASTLTPVVVFVPLAFLDGVSGTFFKALAMTMVVALLTSLLLALTLIPALASWWDFKETKHHPSDDSGLSGPNYFTPGLFAHLMHFYKICLQNVLIKPWLIAVPVTVALIVSVYYYNHLESEFLPYMDEGGFVIDYHAPWGTSLAETNRQLQQAEAILKAIPELEGYSRRTGARLALGISQAHQGDFLVKLKHDRQRTTDQVIAELRRQFKVQVPGLQWEFAGILGDLIGDLTWSPKPVELKLFSADTQWLKKTAPLVQSKLDQITGVVDTFDGLENTGPSITLKVRSQDATRFGLTTNDIQLAVNTAMLGQKASYVLEGDRVVNIRVRMQASATDSIEHLLNLPIRSMDGRTVKLSQVADAMIEPGQLELHREDLRQVVAVSARLENRDLGSAIAEIKRTMSQDPLFSQGVFELGGLYQQQQSSFINLLLVLTAAVFLVFTILLITFRSFLEPIAILSGAMLAMCGTVIAWHLTGTSVNIVSLLGAIIGIGVVAKNGILVLDAVQQLTVQGMSVQEALLQSGCRRLRPVLMTSLAAGLGLVPLAYGIGAGSDILKPMAIAVIGALVLSVVFSLIATPAFYFLMYRTISRKASLH